ncbi:MAG: hypothetical protein MRERV_3c016 [Mycoplasmataceae bacterium RV_VA103A]|nr:MAG: hypothetical protein MRERV_3c016 [Mycoplasmataceae bacterium RV_VA103A]
MIKNKNLISQPKLKKRVSKTPKSKEEFFILKY